MKLIIAAVLFAGATLIAQEPTFRGATRTVAVYATVTGADARLLPDLPRDAFSIFDNGKPQEIALFANDVQPITVVMLLDRSGSMKANFTLVQQAAERFVDVMLPADKARIGSFSNRIQIELVGELLLARLIQNADAEDSGFTLFKLRQDVAKVT
jgi:hypothetical protein